jgi:hypothetical protein
MHALLWAGLLSTLLSVPDLTPAQREQLQSATDGSSLVDEAAFYPLLQNALTWRPGDEAGARIPDYEALLRDPASLRGELFLLEGQMAGPARPLGALARPIHLDQPQPPTHADVQQWGLLVRSNPDLVAVVYLVDPPPLKQSPGAGRKVRLVGRFFKVWQSRDQAGQATLYPVFVGRTVSGVSGSSGGSAVQPMLLTTLVLAGLLVFTFRRALKLNMKPKPLATRRHEREVAKARRPPEEQLNDLPGPPLPHDPVEALGELERRRRDRDDGPSA